MSALTDRWASSSPRTRILTVAGVVVAVLALAVGAFAVLGGDDDEPERAAPKPKASTTTTTAPITTTTEPPRGPVAPLTGLRLDDPAIAARPALAVKIDNLDAPRESALPQAGLDKADVVFEEIVEGNITRLVAVFHSQNPGRVGPVRSARTTDVHLLPQLGRVLLAWSGGNGGVVGAVRGSPAIIDVGHDAATGAYQRDRSRRAPHNLFVNADELWSRAGDAGAPQQMFAYRDDGEGHPPTAQSAQGVDMGWGGGAASAPVSWRWDPELKLYRRQQAGKTHVAEGGAQVSTVNVVVLVTPYGQSPADLRSPEALTVGSGEAWVLTSGGVVHGSWNRPDEQSVPALVDDAGQPIELTPGQTWIELPRAGEATIVG